MSGPTVTIEPDAPPLEKPFQFTIATVMWITAAVAVFMALVTQAPPIFAVGYVCILLFKPFAWMSQKVLSQHKTEVGVVALAILPIFLVTGGFGFRIIGYRYGRAVDNNPLQAPVKVTKIKGDVLYLEDGRRISVDIPYHSLDEAIQYSGDQIEVTSDNQSNACTIYAKCRRFRCGLGSPMFTIPLFPYDYNKNYVEEIGLGTIIEKPDALSKVDGQ